MATVKATGSATYSYDHETRFNEKGQVQHLESAKRNAVQMGADIVEILPDKFVGGCQLIGEAAGDNDNPWSGIVILFSPFIIVASLLWDALDIVIAPFRLAKDATDTAYHLGAAAVDGREEGTAQPIDASFKRSWYDSEYFKLAEPRGTPGVQVVKS